MTKACGLQTDTIRRNLTCDIECRPGTFLGFDRDTNSSGCVPCANNYYSPGGGVTFKSPYLHKVLHDFSPNCYRRKAAMEGRCAGWDVSTTGQEVETIAAEEHGWQESHLTGKFLLVKPGYFMIKYRKQNRALNSQVLGLFTVGLNGTICVNDSSLDYGWRNEKTALPVGEVEVWVKYRFFHIEGVSMTAGIAEIEISGVKKADTECWKCESGWSLFGASNCSACPANSYYNSSAHACLNCPSGLASPPNSLSSDNCHPLPPCSDSDYVVTTGACVNQTQTITTMIRPMVMCNDTEDKTGVRVDLCRPCTPGYHYEDSTCRQCPKGTHSSYEDCLPCELGTYSRLLLKLTSWQPLPDGFLNECLSPGGSSCSSAWRTTATVLIAGSGGTLGEELVLSRYVDVVQTQAYVAFTYTISGISGTRVLSLEIDSYEMASFSAAGLQMHSGEIPLSKGIRKVALVLRTLSDHAQTEVLLHSVEIVGSADGGASQCYACPEGFVSDAGRADCRACPPGSSSFEGTECRPCPYGAIAQQQGVTCTPCPKHTISNRDFTACVANAYIETPSDRQIAIQELARNDGYLGVCNKTSVRSHCKESFYGPIRHEQNRFFLSILNPAKSPAGLNSDPYTYAYLLTPIDNSGNKPCKAKEVEEAVSLGSQIESVEVNTTAVVVRYGHGSECKGGRWRTRVDLVCDKAAGEGWPHVTSLSDCEVSFAWRTAFVCRVCEDTDLLRMTSICQSGYRYETTWEPHNCITRRSTIQTKRKVECSVGAEVMKTWPALIGAVLFAFLLPVSFFLLICYVRLKRRYISLMEVSSVRVHD